MYGVQSWSPSLSEENEVKLRILILFSYTFKMVSDSVFIPIRPFASVVLRNVYDYIYGLLCANSYSCARPQPAKMIFICKLYLFFSFFLFFPLPNLAVDLYACCLCQLVHTTAPLSRAQCLASVRLPCPQSSTETFFKRSSSPSL